ncbi:MAG: chlorite dismutase family protein [Acidimicrobiia bacterium]
MSLESVSPSVGWGVLHLYYRVDRTRAGEPGGAKRILDAIVALEADGHQVIVSSVLGHKADLGVMALGPDLARLQQFQQEMLEGPLVPEYSYVSLTEQSEYGQTEDDERARLADDEQVTDPAEVEARVAVWRDRIAHYREQRIHPKLPPKATMCFYPMSKRRTADDNWYGLDFDARKQLMSGHARVGRTYAGRVLQLITGSTGLDEWEWGVTLFADDIVALKEIVYEMRFDEVSARYAEFGPFIACLIGAPEQVLDSVGVRS